MKLAVFVKWEGLYAALSLYTNTDVYTRCMFCLLMLIALYESLWNVSRSMFQMIKKHWSIDISIIDQCKKVNENEMWFCTLLQENILWLQYWAAAVEQL